MRICEYGENAPLWGGMNHKTNGSYMLSSPQKIETRGRNWPILQDGHKS